MKIISYFLAVFLTSSLALADDRPNSAIKPTHRLKNPVWKKRFEELKSTPSTSDILFLGDSITEGWNYTGTFKKYFPSQVFNAGFAGDRTQHVLWRLQNGQISHLNPKLIVLMIGTNNTLSNTPQEIASGIKTILDELKSRKPNAKILLIGIIPSGANPTAQRRIENNQVNQIIKGFTEDNKIFYWNADYIFLEKNGKISKKIMKDYLHPSNLAYREWAKAMAPRINKILQ